MVDDAQKYLTQKKLKVDEVKAKATELPDYSTQSEIQRRGEEERTVKSVDSKSVEEGRGSEPSPLKGSETNLKLFLKEDQVKWRLSWTTTNSSSRKQKKAVSGQEEKSGCVLIPQEDTDAFQKRANDVHRDITQRIVFKNMSREVLKVTDDGEVLKVEEEDEHSKNVKDRKLSMDIDHGNQTEMDHHHPTSPTEEDKKSDTAPSSDGMVPAVNSIASGASAVIKRSMVCERNNVSMQIKTVVESSNIGNSYVKTVAANGICDDTYTTRAVKNLNTADIKACTDHVSLDGGSVSGKSDESNKKVGKVPLNAHDLPPVQKNQSCAICDSLPDKKPHTVNTWHMMGQVLKYCTQPGHEQQDTNEKDYICLSSVHLQNRKGKWFITDGTEFHNPDELESSFEKPEEFNSKNVVSGNGIAEQIRKKKRVKLGNTVICDWVPNTREGPGKWRVYLGNSQQEEAPLSSPEVSFVSSPFERAITVRKPGYVAVEDIDCGSSEDSETAKSITNDCCDLQNDRENTEQTLPQRPDANIQDIHHDSSGDLISVPGVMIPYTSKQFKDKAKQFQGLKIMSSPMPSRTSSTNPTDMFMSNEFLIIRENVLVPLNRSVNLIRNHFASAESAQHQNQLGNDEYTTSIGWLIRNQFCKVIADVLRIGMKMNAMPAQLFFGETTGLNPWDLMKEVAIACETEPVLLEMVKVIEVSSFLFDDNMRFQGLICELLNSCNHDGSEKLLMTWFRKFLILEPVLCKFYSHGSFWRIQNQLQTCHLVEEFMLQLAQLNDFPFNLHADFEFVQLRKAEEEKRNQAGIVFKREEKYNDSGSFAFE